MAGIVVLAALGAASWTADRQLRRFLSALDERRRSVRRARRSSSCWRASAISWSSEVKVLADDNRIRSTVLAPKFDEATVQDILEDLRKSSGATLLAVRRRERQGAGGGRRRRACARSTWARRRRSRPASTARPRTSGRCPTRCRSSGVAPIRSGDQTPALLVKGLSLGREPAGHRREGAGRDGRAVHRRARRRAAARRRPELDEALRAGGQHGRRNRAGVSAGGRSYLVRLARAGDGATAAQARLAGAASPPVRAGARAVVAGLVPGRRSAR